MLSSVYPIEALPKLTGVFILRGLLGRPAAPWHVADILIILAPILRLSRMIRFIPIIYPIIHLLIGFFL